ncbi:hypothetical protein V8B97DRAFT_1976484 [Scleroderma yunnanense]
MSIASQACLLIRLAIGFIVSRTQGNAMCEAYARHAWGGHYVHPKLNIQVKEEWFGPKSLEFRMCPAANLVEPSRALLPWGYY